MESSDFPTRETWPINDNPTMDSSNYLAFCNSLPELISADIGRLLDNNQRSLTILTKRERWPNIRRVISILCRFRKVCKVSKGVMRRENGKFCCEIRIAKEIATDKSYRKPKVWLGTFRSATQAARALDVGKVFFSGEKRKNYHDPETETKLLTVKDNLRAKTTNDMVEFVQELAKHYGENGKVPPSDWRGERVQRRSRQKKPHL